MNKRQREIILPDKEARRDLNRRSRRGFLIGGLAAVGAIGGYEWLRNAKQDNQRPWPERRVLDANGRLAHAYLSDNHLMPTYSPNEVTPLKANGDIGLTEAIDPGQWSLAVTSDAGGPDLTLLLRDIQALPRVEMITKFCCIEGWSTISHWAGARFSDFTKKYYPPGRKLTNYVSLTTPDEEYYVGLDMKSALHPQTLLAYEYDGKPLSPAHGAPLRLVIPVKYGIKNLKRIGAIEYSDERPDDYWAEEGYDWFAGL
ncbi:MAG TPA: molybdopterin-dependent oxidoreductase [Bryobacteraceae bacterium]|nr:molybdopterin-dependent oxidoreductase [Bryobacteraceae bacterium]